MRPIPGSPADIPSRPGMTASWVAGTRARKRYVCPSCTNPIEVGEAHVVAWPDDRVDHRDHWHTHCWRHAARTER